MTVLRKLGPVLGGPVVGMAAGVGPLVALCSAGAVASLLKVARAEGESSAPPGAAARSPGRESGER